MNKYWITFLLGGLKQVKDIKSNIDNINWEVFDYTEGIIPKNHLSVNFIVEDDEDIENLKDICDGIMLEYGSIYCIIYGMDVLEYYDWERNELTNM